MAATTTPTTRDDEYDDNDWLYTHFTGITVAVATNDDGDDDDCDDCDDCFCLARLALGAGTFE